MNKVKTRGTPEPAEWPAWLPPGVKSDRAPRGAGTEPSAGSHLPCPARTKASGPVPKRYTPGAHGARGGRGAGGSREMLWPFSGAFRLWKYHLPAGIIQPNYTDNHRCGGEARKNARVFRVIPYLFRRRKRFRGSFPQQGKASGPKIRGPGSAWCRCRLSGGALQPLTPGTL